MKAQTVMGMGKQIDKQAVEHQAMDHHTDRQETACQETTCQEQETTCQETVELLPWLLNDTLDETEIASVVAHLAVCEPCRRELQETTEIGQLMVQHIPSLALAEYAQGLTPSEVGREQIESHLAGCCSCRRELSWAKEGQIVDFDEARDRISRSRATRMMQPPATWRRLALAAGFAGLLVSSSLVWKQSFDLGPAGPTSETNTHVSSISPETNSQFELTGALFGDSFESGKIDRWSVPGPGAQDSTRVVTFH